MNVAMMCSDGVIVSHSVNSPSIGARNAMIASACDMTSLTCCEYPAYKCFPFHMLHFRLTPSTNTTYSILRHTRYYTTHSSYLSWRSNRIAEPTTRLSCRKRQASRRTQTRIRSSIPDRGVYLSFFVEFFSLLFDRFPVYLNV